MRNWKCAVARHATLWTLAILTTTAANAAAPKINTDIESKFFGNIACRDQVFNELSSMRATREWSLPNAREMDGSRRFHTPTEVVGVWVEARIFMNGEALLRRITGNFVETRTFDLQTCKLRKVTQRSRELFDQPSQGQNAFTDQALRSLIKDGSRGVIYIWSPNMPYSYKKVNGTSGIENLQSAAERLKMKVTVVIDPNANPQFSQRVMAQNSQLPPDALRSAKSIELALRSMRTHYPAIIVYSKGRLARHGYPGIGTADEYFNYMKGEIDELEK